MAAALEGVRIVDMTQVMAGPFCTMLLGDLGADVIKVEPPHGDMARGMGGEDMRLEGDDNAPFLAINRNKRSIVLDLKSEEGLASFHDLVRTADIVIENFRPGVARKLGVDYETLRAIRPGLVYASISGFGQSGPYAERPGFDLIAQAMSGIMSVTGEPDGEPVKCGVPISDLTAGLYGALSVLAAYIHRMRTGEGQYLETSLFEAALGISIWETTELWATGRTPRPFGSAHRLNAPYQALRTADGHLVLAAITDRQWFALCEALDIGELAEDPRFRTNVDRMANRRALVAALEAALARDTTDAWVERLLEDGVPAAPIHDYRQVFEDPHTVARDMVQELEHPVEGRVRTLGFPFKLSATPATIRHPPPLLGEHTQALLDELEGDVDSRAAADADRGGA